MRAYFLAVCLFFSYTVQAQSPRVPSKMEFANITLRIKDDARKEIQKDVDALTRSTRHYNIYVQRARTFFPIIEEVFRQEGVPVDFKYLAIQESGLQPDVVSSSNAVGYWQFKDFTARENGLRVDKTIDERMNIVAASRGAAKYMKKNNIHYFDNWLISLQAYQMGPGAAIKAGGKKYAGQRSMTIDRHTYWYIKKYLAHKVAFENISDGAADLQVVAYTEGANKSLAEISRETGVSQNDIEEYNKWLRRGKVPTDKSYAVILPVSSAVTKKLAKEMPEGVPQRSIRGVASGYAYEYAFTKAHLYPVFKNRTEALTGKVTRINGRKAIVARRGDRPVSLATKGEITLKKFYKYNDLKNGANLVEGQVYYLQNKQSKQPVFHHVAREGESLWDISQLYGLKLKKLKTRNRIRGNAGIKSDQIIWLRYIRPREIPVEFRKNEPTADPVEPVLLVKEVIPEKEEPREEETELVFASNSAETISIQEDNSDVPEWPASVSAEEAENPETSTDEPEEPEVETREWNSDSKEIVHTISAGETLYSISRDYDVDINRILELNSMQINDPLKIGQKLKIEVDAAKSTKNQELPEIKSDESREIYYTVKPGDTMYGISRKHDLSVDELRKLNGKEDYVVKTGEKLRIK